MLLTFLMGKWQYMDNKDFKTIITDKKSNYWEGVIEYKNKPIRKVKFSSISNLIGRCNYKYKEIGDIAVTLQETKIGKEII